MKVLGLALVFAFLALRRSMRAGLCRSQSFTVPTGIFGAVFSEYVVNKLAALLGSTSDGYQNSVYMQIGIIMIIGLAAKNAILIVEFRQRTCRSRDGPGRCCQGSGKSSVSAPRSS